VGDFEGKLLWYLVHQLETALYLLSETIKKWCGWCAFGVRARLIIGIASRKSGAPAAQYSSCLHGGEITSCHNQNIANNYYLNK
jgi:hypothetical protein